MSQLDSERLLSLLKEGGLLSRSISHFESRKEQQAMMRNVIDAFNKKQIALIEAGTGTGKSMAYLIPALVAAVQFKEKIVISTNTIALQEQLLFKDIPLVSNALNISLKTVIVKGMGNYLCRRKLEELEVSKLFLSSQEKEEIEKIEEWASQTTEGTKSSLKIAVNPALWEQVSAEHDSCNNVECKQYQNCFFFKARRTLNDASLLIVNHHLLFAELATRAETDNWTGTALLPFFDRLILDEAHNIEDIATEYFASRLSRLEILRIMGRLNSEKSAASAGKLPQLKDKLQIVLSKQPSKEGLTLFNRLTLELPAIRRSLLKAISESFQAFHDFLSCSVGLKQTGEGKLRLLSAHLESNLWKQSIILKTNELAECLNSYAFGLNSIEADIKSINSDRLNEQTKAMRFEIKALSKRLEEALKIVKDFTQKEILSNSVRWIESENYRGALNTSLVHANLDVSKLLVDRLFSRISTIVLCSATLTSDRKFSFLRARLGLNVSFAQTRVISENIYDSPFNFDKQALLLIPEDLPNPSHIDFITHASELILKILHASKGSAFVLFTSYSMLKTCAELLDQKLKEGRFPLFKQGDASRQILLQKFKKAERGVLFGTDSFWEGVDVVGEALRCVIIAKLPFKVPSDPLLQARAENLLSKQQDPFFHYFLPQAVVKFKQGFGRLIRNKKDRGCIVCLDNRIITKAYGKIFLNSLPKCEQVIALSEKIPQHMTEFYKKTYFLTR